MVNNAIDLDGFAFDAWARNEMRAQLGVGGDDFVVGNVGRTNQTTGTSSARLRCFMRSLPNQSWFIVGEGKLMSKWVSLASSLGISDSVIFAILASDALTGEIALTPFLSYLRLEGAMRPGRSGRCESLCAAPGVVRTHRQGLWTYFEWAYYVPYEYAIGSSVHTYWNLVATAIYAVAIALYLVRCKMDCFLRD